jgi:hypothetical protein
MSMILVVLLVVLLPPLQTAAAQTTSTMQPDVDRLVQAAEKLAGTWPSQPPPAVPEVAVVARHGKAVVALLMVLLSDDPDAERDPKRWKVQQQVSLALSRIYSESQHCGRTYCDGDPPERIARVRDGWLRVIASDEERQALSARELLERFKAEKVFCGSRLIETPGVHPVIVRDWLGHANITTTSRYLATSAHGLTDAARKFEAARAGFAHGSHTNTDQYTEADGAVNTEKVESKAVEVVSRIFASWNHIAEWVRRLDGLRQVA